MRLLLKSSSLVSLCIALSGVSQSSFALDFKALVEDQIKASQAETQKQSEAAPQAAEEATTTSTASTLPDKEVASGLKEALSLGTKTAVELLGQEGGYLNNEAIRIPLPGTLNMVGKALRKVGQGEQVDSFVKTMNQAAEKSVVEAADVFTQVVNDLTVEDAQALLQGGDNAATEYFKTESYSALQNRMLPIIQQVTEESGVTSAYKALSGQMPSGGGETAEGGADLKALGQLLGAATGQNIGTEDAENFDLDQYITKGALDGLFVTLAEQEKLIRNNPAARATSLLQKVFGQ